MIKDENYEKQNKTFFIGNCIFSIAGLRGISLHKSCISRTEWYDHHGQIHGLAGRH